MKTLVTLFTTLLFAASFAQSYADDCLDSLEMPSSFSPNGDEMNDVVNLYFPCPPEEFEIKFFNRWGEAIFESTDYNFIWDGTRDKQPLPSGTYIWILNYTFNSKEVTKKGHLTIVR